MTPHIVFLPGASGAEEFWTPVADRLPGGWKTQLLSWPGAGAEPHDATITGYGSLVARAAAATCDGSDVVAQSMGGVVAIGLALAHPRKIRRLVLVVTSGGLDVGGLGAREWREEYMSTFPNAAPWVTQQRVDHTAGLQSIEIPTCLIWGDDDPISPVAIGQALERKLSHSSLHVITGGTHDVARDQPDAVASLIVGHLS